MFRNEKWFLKVLIKNVTFTWYVLSDFQDVAVDEEDDVTCKNLEKLKAKANKAQKKRILKRKYIKFCFSFRIMSQKI